MEQNAIEENNVLDQLLMQGGLIVPYSKNYILFKFRKFSLLVLICKYCIYGSSLPTC